MTSEPAVRYRIVPARPAAPGENVEIYGTGFGPTATPVDITKIFQGAVPLADPSQLHVTLGGLPANVTFAGVSSNGLYQFNVEIPNLFDGDYEVIAEIGGMKVPGGRMITVAAPSLQ